MLQNSDYRPERVLWRSSDYPLLSKVRINYTYNFLEKFPNSPRQGTLLFSCSYCYKIF